MPTASNMYNGQQRLQQIRAQFGAPLARLNFEPEFERDFRRESGQAFKPIACAAFVAVMVLIAAITAVDHLLLEGRIDAPILWAMFGVEYPVMLTLFVVVWRLRNPERLPELMTVLMLGQCIMFSWVAAMLAEPGDAVPYLYESMILYQSFLFFFTGVMFHAAVALGVLGIAVPAAAYLTVGVGLQAVVHATLFLLATSALGICVRYLLERLLRIDYLRRSMSELTSRMDPLTELLNRRGFEQGLQTMLRQARRDQRPVGMLMIDLDNFKQVNDRLGHAQGDVLLEQVSRTLESCARRPLDLVCRYGGDEFVVALFDMPEQSMEEFAADVRSALTAASRRWLEHVPGFGASVGAVWFAPGDAPANMSAMLDMLDRTLYAAKRNGKGQVNFERNRDWCSLPIADGAVLGQAPSG